MTGISLSQLDPALLASATKKPDIDMEKIDKTAQEFEAMFLSEMFKPMFESVKVNDTFGGGKGEEIFSGFLRDEYGKIMAQTGGIGIAELVKQQLIEMQSKAAKPTLAQNLHGNSTDIIGDTANAV
jgi:flagellar protein FlgJ